MMESGEFLAKNYQLETENYGMNPCVRHTCTMPRRSSAPIFCFIRYKWFFTVCSERQKRLAISLFVSPSATSGISCCSRRVNPSRWRTLAEGKDVASRSKYRNNVAHSLPGQIASPPCSARTPSTTSSAEASLGRYPRTPARTHCRNSACSPVIPIRRIRTLGEVVRTFRTAVRSSLMIPRDDRRRTSVSSSSKSSARNGSSMSVPTTSISPLLTSIRESASLSRRFSAATKTRGLVPAAVLPFTRAALSSTAMLVRRSPFELIFFGACSASCKIWRVPAFIVGHPPRVFALMSMPNVMISDLLEPHAYASPLQFCSRASIPFQFSRAAVNPQQMNRLRSHPLLPLFPPRSRIGTKPASQLQFGTPFSLPL